MGPCRYCGKMIFLDWIAERGYHRVCHEESERRLKVDGPIVQAQRAVKAEREHEKRRERKRLKRIAEKAGRR